MEVIDTYSGIGGFSLAAHWMGWETIQFCDIDPYSQELLKVRFPGSPIHGDIRTLTHEIIKKNRKNPSARSILVGGFPCQPYSLAGSRKGNLDDRALWPHSLRLLNEVRPDWSVFENVAGITSMENECPPEKWVSLGMEGKINFRRIYNRFLYRKRQTYVLNEICEDIEKAGYSLQVFIIPACAIEASHRRDRIWVVARKIFDTNPNCIQRHKEREKELLVEQGEGGYKGCRINGIRKQNINSDPNGFGFQGRTKFRSFLELWEKSSSEQSTGLYERNLRQLRTFPTIPGKHDGISRRLDKHRDSKRRNKGLGNAIVPQVVYEIFKAIEATDRKRK